MTTAVQRRRGTTTEHASFTGLEGEISVNTTKETLVVHDGATAGGFELARADGSNFIASNVDINGGTIDGTAIGASSASTGAFTTLAATGIDVTGTATMDGLTVDGRTDLRGGATPLGVYRTLALGVDTQSEIVLGSQDLSNNYVDAAKIRGLLKANKTDGELSLYTLSSSTLTPRLNIASNGNLSLYEDTGTTPKLFWDASAEKLNLTGAGGLDVTGTATMDGLVSSGDLLVGRTSAFTTARLEIQNDETLQVALNNSVTNSDGQMLSLYSGGGLVGGIGNTALNLNIYRGAIPAININNSTGDVSLYDDTGTTAKFFWDASAESLGIGTSSPARALHVVGTGRPAEFGSDNVINYVKLYNSATGNGTYNGLDFLVNSTSNSQINAYGMPLTFGTSASNGTDVTERMRIDSSGRVGIGGTPDGKFKVVSGSSPNGANILIGYNGTSENYFDANTQIFRNGAFAERMRIDSSGNLLVGTTSTANNTDGIRLLNAGYISIAQDSNNVPCGFFNKITHDGNILEFQKDGSTVGSIGTGGDGGLFIHSPYGADSGIVFASEIVAPCTSTGAFEDGVQNLGYSSARWKDLYLSGNITMGSTAQINASNAFYLDSNVIHFRRNNEAESARIDSSGNLLVGKTSDAFNTVGVQLLSTGRVYATATDVAPMFSNRKGNDGSVMDFAKDGTTVGSIGTGGGDLIVGNGSVGVRFNDAISALVPRTTGDSGSDGAIDLGASSARFDDIYATNGTIQTSDRNEKQDIAELSDAEQRVAVACKGLLRKFRWKDSVAEKGDDARIHFGIIAQDLQAAFEAEGLDAGDYGMFTSTTWTDEETNEEKTRLGIRYSELLAFIISAL